MARDARKRDVQAERRARLLPHVRERLEALQAACAVEGLQTFVVSTRRTPEEQAAKVAQGVSSTGSRSWHLLGRAVDLVPVVGGVPDLEGKHVERFRQMHKIAAALGWRGLAFHEDGSLRYIKTSAGRIWDGGHLECRDGLTWAAAKAEAVAAERAEAVAQRKAEAAKRSRVV